MEKFFKITEKDIEDTKDKFKKIDFSDFSNAEPIIPNAVLIAKQMIDDCSLSLTELSVLNRDLRDAHSDNKIIYGNDFYAREDKEKTICLKKYIDTAQTLYEKILEQLKDTDRIFCGIHASQYLMLSKYFRQEFNKKSGIYKIGYIDGIPIFVFPMSIDEENAIYLEMKDKLYKFHILNMQNEF